MCGHKITCLASHSVITNHIPDIDDFIMSPIDTQQTGVTALMLASRNGYLPVAQHLIDKGAIIDHQDKVCHLVLCVHLYSRVASEVVCVSICVLVCVHGCADSNISNLNTKLIPPVVTLSCMCGRN